VIGIFFNLSCNKTEALLIDNTSVATAPPQKGGVALTFDDYSIDNWHKYLGLFDSLGAKATFYISNYDLLTAKQKHKLLEIQQHGHEIAFHSTNHPNFLSYADSSGCSSLLKYEVNNGLELMNRDGFYPKTFAYPYGKHNEIIDKLLLKNFRSVRALNGTGKLINSLVPKQGNKILYSLGIDKSRGITTNKLDEWLRIAQQSDKCIVLVAHKIEVDQSQLQIPYTTLKYLLQKSNELNMHFYTISEISK
jgi:peptidoglycan/xylan/chitin deacetylase (PgdA/CDA1 family)